MQVKHVLTRRSQTYRIRIDVPFATGLTIDPDLVRVSQIHHEHAQRWALGTGKAPWAGVTFGWVERARTWAPRIAGPCCCTDRADAHDPERDRGSPDETVSRSRRGTTRRA